ncbi:TIGR03083 family protein [Arthrobacter sp. cf158]|uniref:maleylpyruvate isomerase N-terminal domain-containing protein n=1 Tax=Arthrobacter sp. cf158 TaxID=1761744 RepID=UPI000898CAA5|nr:maleylpyruvate isomerase N-terminal domain-containing protein [Arthrobacter sp. cf158]SDW90683.1 TIGR03083 family protein [Arthrobacter sp. cf158]
MSTQAIPALERLGSFALEMAARLKNEHWSLPSACPGWSVHDVFIHLTSTLREVVEPESLPSPVSGDLEATNDKHVEHFRAQSPQQTVMDYKALLPLALPALRHMQTPAARDLLVDFDNAGKYPAHLIADSLVFDHYCHLRHDLIEPRGPLEIPQIAPLREFLEPSIKWLMAGLPQMSPSTLASQLAEPVRLFLSGEGGSSWILRRSADGAVSAEHTDKHETAAATIISDADAFILWATGRVGLPEAANLLAIRGNRELGRRVQQHIHVY